MTTVEEARARGEQAAGAARAGEDDEAPLTVDQAAAWVPAEHRDAYLDGAASVLGYRPRIA